MGLTKRERRGDDNGAYGADDPPPISSPAAISEEECFPMILSAESTNSREERSRFQVPTKFHRWCMIQHTLQGATIAPLPRPVRSLRSSSISILIYRRQTLQGSRVARWHNLQLVVKHPCCQRRTRLLPTSWVWYTLRIWYTPNVKGVAENH